MRKQKTLLYLSLIAAVFQLYAEVQCTMLFSREVETTPNGQLDKILHKYLTVMENTLKKQGGKTELSESNMHFLTMILRKMHELRAQTVNEAPQYWHSRQGR